MITHPQKPGLLLVLILMALVHGCARYPVDASRQEQRVMAQPGNSGSLQQAMAPTFYLTDTDKPHNRIVGQADLILVGIFLIALISKLCDSLLVLLLRLMAPRRQTVIFVTDDVQEAVMLADRILLMDRAGGALLRELHVVLPRPRDPSQPAFLDCSRQLHRWLRQSP